MAAGFRTAELSLACCSAEAQPAKHSASVPCDALASYSVTVLSNGFTTMIARYPQKASRISVVLGVHLASASLRAMRRSSSVNRRRTRSGILVSFAWQATLTVNGPSVLWRRSMDFYRQETAHAFR